MPIIACPRHGVVDVDKDQPCPVCSVPSYDLDERGARDVVRPNRELALKNRKSFAGSAAFVAVFVVTSLQPVVALNVGFGGLNVNVIALLVAGVAAAFAARPLALQLEREPRLRRLDAELSRRRV